MVEVGLEYLLPSALAIGVAFLIGWVKKQGKVADGTITISGDLKYVQITIKDIESKLDKNTDKIYELDKRVANHEWRLNEIKKGRDGGTSNGAV